MTLVEATVNLKNSTHNLKTYKNFIYLLVYNFFIIDKNN